MPRRWSILAHTLFGDLPLFAQTRTTFHLWDDGSATTFSCETTDRCRRLSGAVAFVGPSSAQFLADEKSPKQILTKLKAHSGTHWLDPRFFVSLFVKVVCLLLFSGHLPGASAELSVRFETVLTNWSNRFSSDGFWVQHWEDLFKNLEVLMGSGKARPVQLWICDSG